MGDELVLSELVSIGGTWSGLLFENATAGYPLTLTWTFSIDFLEIHRDFGSVSPNLTIDWVPTDASNWQTMNGQRYACTSFGEPIETSIYYFSHHRYERADIAVIEQLDNKVSVQVAVAGDLDGLGLPDVQTKTTLNFEGVHVQTDAVGLDASLAAQLLSNFTDIEGLRPRVRDHNVTFEPVSQ